MLANFQIFSLTCLAVIYEGCLNIELEALCQLPVDALICLQLISVCMLPFFSWKAENNNSKHWKNKQTWGPPSTERRRRVQSGWAGRSRVSGVTCDRKIATRAKGKVCYSWCSCIWSSVSFVIWFLFMAFSETFKVFHNTVASWECSVGHLLKSVCWVLLCVFHFRRLSPWSIWSCWTLSFKVSETFVIFRICSFKKKKSNCFRCSFFQWEFLSGHHLFHLVWCDAECTVDTSASCLHEFSVQFLTDDSVKLGSFILTVDEQQPSWNSLKDAAVDNSQTVCTALVYICSALIIVWRHQPVKLHNS